MLRARYRYWVPNGIGTKWVPNGIGNDSMTLSFFHRKNRTRCVELQRSAFFVLCSLHNAHTTIGWCCRFPRLCVCACHAESLAPRGLARRT